MSFIVIVVLVILKSEEILRSLRVVGLCVLVAEFCLLEDATLTRMNEKLNQYLIGSRELREVRTIE
jgi:hypothetical protein